jgi:hypothetical protein
MQKVSDSRAAPHTMWNFPSIIYFQFLLSLYPSIHPSIRPPGATASNLSRVLGTSLYVSTPCTRYRPVARPPNIKNNANAVKTQIFTAVMGFEPTIQAFAQWDSTRLGTAPIFLSPHLQHTLKFVSGIPWFRSQARCHHHHHHHHYHSNHQETRWNSVQWMQMSQTKSTA